jgi:hypothetical protein
MDMWNRRQVWAEHDAAHARRQRLQQLVLVIALLAVWNVVAVLGHTFDLALHDAPRSSSGYRIAPRATSTGHWTWRTTSSATEPMRARLMPVQP